MLDEMAGHFNGDSSVQHGDFNHYPVGLFVADESSAHPLEGPANDGYSLSIREVSKGYPVHARFHDPTNARDVVLRNHGKAVGETQKTQYSWDLHDSKLGLLEIATEHIAGEQRLLLADPSVSITRRPCGQEIRVPSMLQRFADTLLPARLYLHDDPFAVTYSLILLISCPAQSSPPEWFHQS